MKATRVAPTLRYRTHCHSTLILSKADRELIINAARSRVFDHILKSVTPKSSGASERSKSGMYIVYALFVVISLAEASPTSSYECGACMLMVNEMEAIVKKVDPSKTIEVGSFRVNPTGGQKGLQRIPYARSESHLHEIFDGICEKSKDYKLVVNTLTGKAVFAHKDATYLKEEKKGITHKLHDACNDFADSNEDAIIQFLKKESSEPVKEFCQMELGVCSAVDVSPLPPNEPPVEDEKVEVEEEEANDEL